MIEVSDIEYVSIDESFESISLLLKTTVIVLLVTINNNNNRKRCHVLYRWIEKLVDYFKNIIENVDTIIIAVVVVSM